MDGGPSHLDLFDPKPELTRHARQAAAAELRHGRSRRWASAATRCWPASGKFAQHGAERACGSPTGTRTIAEVRRRPRAGPLVLGRRRQPRRQRLPDEHRQHPGRPAEPGGWVTYGLGTENQDLPGVRRDDRRRRAGRRPAELGQRLAARPRSRGPRSARTAPPILHLEPPPGVSDAPAAGQARPDRRARPPPRRAARRRLAARRPDRRLRAGLPDAGRRPRGGRPGAARRPRPKRLYGLDDPRLPRLRRNVPAGPPAGRAGRPVRAALLRLGQPVGRPPRRRGEPRASSAPGATSRSPACSPT